jgi:hypothetical protein
LSGVSCSPLVAACFLSGCNERFLESRRSLLEARIDERFPTERPDEQPAGGDSLVTARTSRAARGTLLQVGRIVDRGRSRKGVTFRDPTYRRLVLKILWNGYESPFWDAVAEWIDEILIECDSDEIATGLALLADSDFDEVEVSYLDPWASGRRGYRGQLEAALVMWSLCYDVSDNEQLPREALRKALVSFLWVPPGAPRSLRGRPSQVKGACGVAARWRKRHPGPASLYDPSGQHCGQARGLPSTSRGTPRGTNDLGKHT